MSDSGKANLFEIAVAVAVGVVLVVVLSGCNMIPRIPRITVGNTKIDAPRDAGKPAMLDKGEVRTTFAIPAQTLMRIEETSPVPATDTAEGRPSRKVTTFSFTAPTAFEQVANTLTASTGTVDTSVAKQRIQTESKGPLLWAAIGAGAGAIVLMVLKWPSAALLCGIASGAFFAAWRLADIPWWAGLLALTAGGALILGYKRSEWDANSDGIPDRIQKPTS